MKKLRFFFDFDKEEKWLQEMAAKGWQLRSVLFTYTFRKSEPAALPIRMDFHTFYSQSRYQDYLTLFEDCGWKHIAGCKSMGMHYFVRIRPDASDDLFSDTASKAGRYKRVSEMWLSLFVCYMVIFSSLLTNSSNSMLLNYTIHPQSAFLTPDLWNLTGSGFWSAFLLESPFAFFRILAPVLFVLFVAFYGICAFAFLHQYRKCIKTWKNMSSSER
ncbi:MAG: DUF2812 domain-containing protein [Eubacteriales bacterium]